MRFFMSTLENVIFRKDKIVELCTGKSVLHLGFIQHSHLYQKKIDENDWLHSQIAKVASKTVGIDFLPGDVQEIKMKYAYDVYVGDVTRLNEIKLHGFFDVIVCGELIEHLENPGLMLEGIKEFMTQESIVILTTPNPWSREFTSYNRKRVPEEKWLNPEHTMWFSMQTLKQILERCGFELIVSDYYYGQSRKQFFNKTSEGIIGFIRLVKRMVFLSLTPKNQFNGLFFTAKIATKIQQCCQ